MKAEQLAAVEAARSRQNRPEAATRDAAPESIGQLAPERQREWMTLMADTLLALGFAIKEELETGKVAELGAPGKPGKSALSAAGASTPAEASSRNAPDRLSSFGAPSGRTTGIGDAAVRALSIWERLMPSRRHPMVADYLAEGKNARERR